MKSPLDEVCTRYYRDVRLYLYSLCRDAGLSEELTQETFLRALVSLPAAHPNPKAWLLTVAKNLWISYLRRKKPEPLPEGDLPSPAPGPPDLLLRSERESALWRAIEKLGPRAREAVVLQYFEGLSGEETAKMLSLTPGALRVLTLRARRKLKTLLEEDEI